MAKLSTRSRGKYWVMHNARLDRIENINDILDE